MVIGRSKGRIELRNYQIAKDSQWIAASDYFQLRWFINMNIELFLKKRKKSYERLKIGDLSQSFFIRVSLCPSCLMGHMMYAIPGFIETTHKL